MYSGKVDMDNSRQLVSELEFAVGDRRRCRGHQRGRSDPNSVFFNLSRVARRAMRREEAN